MNKSQTIYAEFHNKTNTDLLKMIFVEEHAPSTIAASILISKLLDRVCQLEKEVLFLSGQNEQKRKRKIYYYYDIELTDELLVDYIDSEAFTIYELEKKVGAKKNVLRGRYIRAKKRIQAQKCQHDK
jgi:hypothetical protein